MAQTPDATVVATELVSKPQKIAAPRYRYMRIYPTAGSAALTIAAGNYANVQFEIPTQAFNYSQSYLTGKLSLPTPHANQFGHWLYKDCASFVDRVQLKTRNGATLIDLDYVNNYTRVVNRYETPLEEVMAADGSDILHAVRPDFKFDAEEPNNREYLRPDGEVVKHPYVEAAYLDSGLIRADAPADPVEEGKVEWNFRIPLARLVPNSVFSRKSDLKLPEIAILTFRLGPGTKISWEAKSLTDPDTNAAAATVTTTIADFTLNLARQDDPVYEAMIDERMRAGFSIPINFPLVSRAPPIDGKTQNVAVTYNSGHGLRLVKLYHTFFPQTESKNQAYSNIVDAASLVGYHVKIGGLRTSDEDFKVDEKDPSAYLHHKQLLEGTSITSANVYRYNFAHVEDVGRIGGPKRWRELGFRKDDAEVGVPLTQDFKFEFVSTTNGSPITHYTFAIVQRQLKVNAIAAIVE